MKKFLKHLPLLLMVFATKNSFALGARAPKEDVIPIGDPACHAELSTAIRSAAYEMARDFSLDQVGRDRFTHGPSIYTTRSGGSSRAVVVSKIDEDRCFYIWEISGNFKKDACKIEHPYVVQELMSNGCL